MDGQDLSYFYLQWKTMLDRWINLCQDSIYAKVYETCERMKKKCDRERKDWLLSSEDEESKRALQFQSYKRDYENLMEKCKHPSVRSTIILEILRSCPDGTREVLQELLDLQYVIHRTEHELCLPHEAREELIWNPEEGTWLGTEEQMGKLMLSGNQLLWNWFALSLKSLLSGIMLLDLDVLKSGEVLNLIRQHGYQVYAQEERTIRSHRGMRGSFSGWLYTARHSSSSSSSLSSREQAIVEKVCSSMEKIAEASEERLVQTMQQVGFTKDTMDTFEDALAERIKPYFKKQLPEDLLALPAQVSLLHELVASSAAAASGHNYDSSDASSHRVEIPEEVWNRQTNTLMDILTPLQTQLQDVKGKVDQMAALFEQKQRKQELMMAARNNALKNGGDTSTLGTLPLLSQNLASSESLSLSSASSVSYGNHDQKPSASSSSSFSTRVSDASGDSNEVRTGRMNGGGLRSSSSSFEGGDGNDVRSRDSFFPPSSSVLLTGPTGKGLVLQSGTSKRATMQRTAEQADMTVLGSGLP